MRILLFSDLHLDQPYEWAPPPLGKKRREAAKDSLVQILAEARQRSVDAIACAGGLFHRDCVQPANLRWLMTAFDSVSIPVLLAPGDEDWLDPRSGYTRHAWPSNVTIFDSDRLSPIGLAEDFTVWGAAHRSADGVRSFLDRFYVDRSGVNVALFHASERGGVEREHDARLCAPFSEEDIERTGLNHVLVGHFHRPYFGDHYTYPGAPIAHDFGTDPAGSAALIDFKANGQDERELIPLASTELHDLVLDVSGVTSQPEFARSVKESVSNLKGIVRIRLTGRLPYDVVVNSTDLSALVPKVENLLVETDGLSLDVDVDAVSEEASVRGQFVRDVASSSRLTDVQRDRILSIGLRALEAKSELEGLR